MWLRKIGTLKVEAILVSHNHPWKFAVFMMYTNKLKNKFRELTGLSFIYASLCICLNSALGGYAILGHKEEVDEVSHAS